MRRIILRTLTLTTLHTHEPELRAHDSGASTGGGRGVLRALLVLFCVAAMVKMAVLTMPPEEISPGGLPQHEEWRRGMAAQEWLDGPLLPYLDYQQGHFQGGTLLTIGLDTVSFALFGDSPLTMRLPNLLYDWAAIAFLFVLVDRLVSRRAAWIAGLLAAVPSPGYSMVGAVVWASHVEANAFAMALLYCWTRHVFKGPGGRQGPRGSFLLGALAGICLWFHYGLVVWLVPMLLVEVLRDRRAWMRPAMGARVLGVVVGLLPWWIYNLTHDWMGLGVYGRSAAAHFQTSQTDVAETFTRLVTHFLPHSLYLPEMGGVGRFLELGICLGAGLAWIIVSAGAIRSLVRDREVRPELVLALYPLLWTVLYTFGTFHGQDRWVHGYRYMLPLHPIAWICSGIVLARRPAPVAIGVTGALLVLFAVTTATYLRPDRVRLNASAPGGNTESVGRFVYLRYTYGDQDPQKLVRAMERALTERDPVVADVVLFTLGNCLLFASTAAPTPAMADPERRQLIEETARNDRRSLEALWDAAPEKFKPYFSLLREGERAYKWSERDRFWRQWDRRGDSRPEGAYAY